MKTECNQSAALPGPYAPDTPAPRRPGLRIAFGAQHVFRSKTRGRFPRMECGRRERPRRHSYSPPSWLPPSHKRKYAFAPKGVNLQCRRLVFLRRLQAVARDLVCCDKASPSTMFRPPLYNLFPDLVSCANACMRVGRLPSIGAETAERMLQCSDTCLLWCATIQRETYLPQSLARKCCVLCEQCASLLAQLRWPQCEECASACRECALKLRAGL